MSRHNRERRAARAAKPRCDYCPRPRAQRIFVADPATGKATLVASLCAECFTKLKEYDPWTAERFRSGYLVEETQP